jgi:AMMECR1 domain-containing protein
MPPSYYKDVGLSKSGPGNSEFLCLNCSPKNKDNGTKKTSRTMTDRTTICRVTWKHGMDMEKKCVGLLSSFKQNCKRKPKVSGIGAIKSKRFDESVETELELRQTQVNLTELMAKKRKCTSQEDFDSDNHNYVVRAVLPGSSGIRY